MVVQLAMTSDVLRSCSEFILAKIGERIGMRRTPHSSLSQSVPPRRSGNWQSNVMGFVVTGSSFGKFISFFLFPSSLCERVSTLVGRCCLSQVRGAHCGLFGSF